ncbi:MAG: EI24 domain-containing protein [Spirochaetes bacterium]|nr:EI24 domain-containing protein [Spirochaetota bacterium]
MFERLGRGFSMPWNTFSYMTEKRLWGHTVFPLVLTAAIVVALGFVFWFFVLSYVDNAIKIDANAWPWFIKWFISLFQFIVKIVIVYFLFSVLLNIYIGLFAVVVVPFLTPVVDRILQSEGFTTLQIKNSELFGYIVATIWHMLKRLLWQIFISLLLLFTGPFQPVLNFFFGSYFIGRSYFEIVFDLLGRPKEFNRMAQNVRSEATGLGIFSSVIVFIPFIGALLAPILSTVAATRLFAERARAKPGA